MKIARLAGPVLIAISAMGLAMASSAAALPLFSLASGTFTGESGTNVLRAFQNEVNCKKDAINGTITSSMSVGGVIIHFLECTSKGESKSGCEVSGVGGVTGKGLLLTTTLKGDLGTVLPGTLAGLRLIPASGKTFLTIAKNACTPETKVTGALSALITNGGGLSGKLYFQELGSGELIREMDTLAGLVESLLTAFGTIANDVATDEITYSQNIEVM